MPARVIKAKKPKVASMMLELKRGMTDVTKAGDKFFRLTVMTWEKKPKFKREVEIKDISIIGRIYTEDEIYGYVSEGTKGPYKIRPKRAKALVFQSGYTAKTKPGGLFAVTGGSFGETVHTQEVTHPGIEARDFPKEVAKFIDPYMTGRMQEAMKSAAEKSGHGRK